ncbi:hypothetical protein EMCRGX_G017198 [Ephydatia muelleri]
MGKVGEFSKTWAERKKDQGNLEVNLSNAFKTQEKDLLVLGLSEKFDIPPDLLVSRGERWKTSRQAISPTFTGGKMKQMVPVVQTCVDKLQTVLKQFADNGEAINIKSHLGVFTMESILAVAFGRQTELHSSQGPEDPLLKSARTLFDAQRPDGGAPNIFTLIALKSQLPFVSHLASFLLPKALEDSFRFLYETSKALIKRRREEEHSIKHNDFLQLMLDLETENGSSQNATKIYCLFK